MKNLGFSKVFIGLALLLFVFQPGMVSAQQKAIYYTSTRQTSTYYYVPHLMKSLEAAKQELRTAFTSKYGREIVYDWEKKGFARLRIKKTVVYDDHIEFLLKSGGKRVLYFSKLFGNKIVLYTKTEMRDIGTTYNTGIYCSRSYYYMVSKYGFGRTDTNSIFQTTPLTRKQFYSDYHMPYVDAFYTIQEYMIQQYRDSLLQAFKSVAEKYRAMKVKPVMSEEQRKYVVQANYYTQQKKYPDAIMLYRKVIKINPTSYPTAYNNLALLYAQVNQFQWAIFYMRHYLLLEPESKSARAAQDKIYEWDLKVKTLQ